jgi:hypothetical protein
MALTALAGPVSNFILAAFLLFIYGLTYAFLRESGFGREVLELIRITAYLSIALVYLI